MDDRIGRLGAANGTDRAAVQAAGIVKSLARERRAMVAPLARRSLTEHARRAAGHELSHSSIEFSVRRAVACRGRAMPVSETFNDARARGMTCAAGKIVGAVEILPHQI